jgi:hypothetical protein
MRTYLFLFLATSALACSDSEGDGGSGGSGASGGEGASGGSGGGPTGSGGDGGVASAAGGSGVGGDGGAAGGEGGTGGTGGAPPGPCGAGNGACDTCVKSSCCDDYLAAMGEPEFPCYYDCLEAGGGTYDCTAECSPIEFPPVAITLFMMCAEASCGPACGG